MRTHKYGVAARDDRTYRDVVYDSKAEAIRAYQLDLLRRGGEIVEWFRQVKVPLGSDFSTRVDFMVVDKSGVTYVEEVKGVETSDFRRVRKLWAKYGPYRMKILKARKGSSWAVEWVNGKQGDDDRDNDQGTRSSNAD